MRRKIELLKLQIKSAFISIPKILLGTIILAVIVATVIGAFLLVSKESDDGKLRVAVYSEDDEAEKYVQRGMGVVGDMDTINTVCEFIWTTKEDGFAGLKDNRYEAMIIIPKDFIEGIMYGENTPVQFICEEAGIGMKSMLFREMITAGGNDVAVGESGIYALDDLFYDTLRLFKSDRVKYEDRLNQRYFEYAIDRDIYFKMRDVSKNEGFTTEQFYLGTAILLLLLMSGFTCSSNLKVDPKAMIVSLKSHGISAFELGCFKTIGISMVYMLLLWVGYLLTAVFGLQYAKAAEFIRFTSVLGFISVTFGIAVLCFSVFSFIYLIFNLVRNPVYSVLSLFLIGVVFMYISGCFISSAMLPKMLREIGYFLPTKWFSDIASDIIKGHVGIGIIVINLVIALICQGIAAGVEKLRND